MKYKPVKGTSKGSFGLLGGSPCQLQLWRNYQSLSYCSDLRFPYISPHPSPRHLNKSIQCRIRKQLTPHLLFKNNLLQKEKKYNAV